MDSTETRPTRRDRPAGGSAWGDEGALEPVGRAEDRVEWEREEVAAECRALDRFADRVEAIEIPRPVLPAQAGGSLPAVDDAAGRMERVRTAYRETVMALAHYDREYGEPLVVHLAGEVGSDLARGVHAGGDEVFTPQFKGALLAAVRQARDERDAFLSTLEAEAASLAEAREALGAVAEALARDGEGRRAGDRGPPGPLPERLDAVVAERQELLHRRSPPHRVTGHDLCTYLYQGEEWTYPVLAAAAALRRRLRAPHDR